MHDLYQHLDNVMDRPSLRRNGCMCMIINDVASYVTMGGVTGQAMGSLKTTDETSYMSQSAIIG